MRLNVSSNRFLTCIVSCVLALAMSLVRLQARPDAPDGKGAQGPPPAPHMEQPQFARLSPEQLRQLVAPIALYPDALVAQILAASAYPTQIVEADRFLQENPNLSGAALGAQVDQQDWDPSIKALTQFPSVLANMDKDLSWTSELGDANYNQPTDIMGAIQFLRQQAEAAGRLQNTPQQTVTTQGSTIIIQPADPQVVYVPEYDPELVYGYPIGLWPGFNPWWGISGPYISFGMGFGIGAFFGFGWGWHGWGCDWGHGGLFYGGGRYAFHSHAFYDRSAYFHGNFRGYAPFARGDRNLRGFAPREGSAFGSARGSERSFGPARGPERSFNRSMRSAGGWGGRSVGPAMRSWGRAGAFGGITHGGDARSFSSRGRFSMGGGMRGGGFRGGGFRGGGGRR
jgi:uncharacterized membrane protein YgcG